MIDLTCPSDWSISSLGLLLDSIQSGKSVKCDERPPQGTEKGLVKISAVTWGEFDEQESKTLLSADHLLASHKIQKGDLLISRANTLELVGATAIVKNLVKDLYLSDKVLRLETKSDFKPLIHAFLKSTAGRRQIEALATGNQLSMRNISQNALKSIQIPLIPLAEQKIIAQKLDTLLAQVENTKARLERTRETIKQFRQSVLAAAVSGKLTEEWRIGGGTDEIAVEKISERYEVADSVGRTCPKEWTRSAIGNIASFQQGMQIAKSTRHKTPAANRLPILRIGNYETAFTEDVDYVDLDDTSLIAEPGDVILTRTGETID